MRSDIYCGNLLWQSVLTLPRSGGVDANIGMEFAFGRKTFSWDIWRFHHDGFILAETEFESPLKGWME